MNELHIVNVSNLMAGLQQLLAAAGLPSAVVEFSLPHAPTPLHESNNID